MIAYEAPTWLPGGHAQTIYPLLIRPAPLPYHRERWATPDGDFIDVDWAAPPQSVRAGPGRPLLVLFHGLEGSSASHYAVSLMRALAAIGWTGAVVHFRGCSGELNRLPRAYHSGDSEEIDWVLRRLQARFSNRSRYAVGVSLGGNVLLKWLGERGTAASDVLQAAAAISAPLDLAASGHHLGRNFNRLYTAYFLRTLKRSARDRLRRFPGLFDEQRMAAARTLYEFDDAVTAPLHGFAGVDDYWRRASSKPWLAGIRLPTLILNATNDPFLPASALPSPHDTARAVRLEFPSHGGHVGFVVGRPPGSIAWLPQRILHFLQHEV
ncbi:hydrolase [Accumulibacter sp.]|uniref:hydrolase n=1 Tax=Accumulibacter sp. TaxID=2053492 RepID=UPI0025E8B345|nr:hydrolase [Accumulibacter sp.]MCM8595803.1 hydrolase [Accumulibacter sp.]MCM8626524.1 hydrolase [Accumulibacter sp.]MDS4049951.1 hydrolase [Accumulibacter sp.]